MRAKGMGFSGFAVAGGKFTFPFALSKIESLINIRYSYAAQPIRVACCYG
jgi:hypothetical protein